MLLWLIEGFGRADRLVEKSRDMGATWLCLCAIEWAWHFHEGVSFLVASRKEEYVDKTRDPKTLFWKLDYLHSRQPAWLLGSYSPENDRLKNHIYHPDTESTIDGESTNADLGRGDRRTAILLDEFATVENSYHILAAAGQATNCCILNSTPKGTETAFYDRRQQLPAEQVRRLHWTMHPEKSAGLYYDDAGRARSPWYDQESRRAPHRQWIAQELDIDYASSAWQFFDAELLDKLIAETATPPTREGELNFAVADDYRRLEPEWLDQPGGRLKLWMHVDPVTKRPVQRGLYVVGCDVATGKGGAMSSNSVASILDRQTGTKVGEFASNRLSPESFARFAVALCLWLDERGAFLIWEDNGPGAQFGRQVSDLGYARVFMREDEKALFGKKQAKPGWYSSKEIKRMLLGNYATALLEGKFVNRSEAALRECGEYVHGPNGDIYHAGAKKGVEPTSEGENHGDRVIADALCWRAVKDVPLRQTDEIRRAPLGSLAARRARRATKLRREARRW